AQGGDTAGYHRFGQEEPPTLPRFRSEIVVRGIVALLSHRTPPFPSPNPPLHRTRRADRLPSMAVSRARRAGKLDVGRAPSAPDLHTGCRVSLSVGCRLRREVTRNLKTRSGGRAPGGTRPTTNDSAAAPGATECHGKPQWGRGRLQRLVRVLLGSTW